VRRIYRRQCPCPTDWRDRVERSIPDYPEFCKQATAFEALPLNSPERRDGFAAFAPHVLVKKKSGKPDFPAIWGKHKETIAVMSFQKCVYCEGPINALRASHVEHFKPKAVFPLLAYEWTNYFLGCAGCNGAKAHHWPERGGYLRPDQGDPSRHFVFEADGTVTAVKAGSAADRTLTDLDLKRQWLVNRRRFNIEAMMRLLDYAVLRYRNGDKAEANQLARIILRNVSDPAAAYSAALEQHFWRVWKAACPKAKV
jgi:uncharacterized protein (TIGR02646 family)